LAAIDFDVKSGRLGKTPIAVSTVVICATAVGIGGLEITLSIVVAGTGLSLSNAKDGGSQNDGSARE